MAIFDYSQLIKTIPLRRITFGKDPSGNERIFICTQSESVIGISMDDLSVNVYNRSYFNNSYPQVSGSNISDDFLFYGLSGTDATIARMNKQTGEPTFIYLLKHEMPYANMAFGILNLNGRWRIPPSDDGNFIVSNERFRAVPGSKKLNWITNNIDWVNFLPDQEREHAFARYNLNVIRLDFGGGNALNGDYVNYPFDKVTLSSLINTIKTEAAGLGLTLNWNQPILLHWDDAVTGSPTRRVFTFVDGSWKVIDVRSGVNYFDTQITSESSNIYSTALSASWIDQASFPVSPTINVDDFEGLAVDTIPSFDLNQYLDSAFKVGNDILFNRSYAGAKSYFFGFAMDVNDGSHNPYENPDVYSDYYNNGNIEGINWAMCLVSFPADENGYTVAGNPHRILMHKNGDRLVGSQDWGYIRPSDGGFELLDIDSPPAGYTITQVDFFDPDDTNYLGVYVNPLNEQAVEVNGIPVYRDSEGKVITSIGQDFISNVNSEGRFGTLNLEVYPDIDNDPDLVHNISVDNICANDGTICNAFEVTPDRLSIAGTVYSGAAYYSGISGSSLSLINSYSDVISYRNGLPIQSGTFGKTLWYGYLGLVELVEHDTGLFTKIAQGVGTVRTAALLNTTQILINGSSVREPSYKGQYNSVQLVDHVLKQKAIDLPNQPNWFSRDYNLFLRNKYNLLLDSYTNAEAEAEFSDFEAKNNQTRAETIADLKDCCPYKCLQMDSMSNTEIIGALEWNEYGALRDIQIATTKGGAIFIGSDDDNATQYPRAFYINSPDFNTLIESDYKLVEFQVPGLLSQSTIGRCVVTDNRIAFFYNDQANQEARIYVVTKAAFISAANGSGIITSFENVFNYNIGSNSTIYGWGDGSNSSSEQGNQFYVAGQADTVFASINSLTNNNRILRINIQSGVAIPIGVSEITQNRVVSYNSTTDNLLIGDVQVLKKIPSASSATLENLD